jgi:hypothetical protein
VNTHEQTKLLLSNGAILQVIFNGKDNKVFHTLACETAFYKKLGFKTNVIDRFIDILRDIPFSFDKLTLHGFDCIGLPPNIMFEDFLPNSFMQKTFGKEFLKSSEDYTTGIIDKIKTKKAEFADRCILFLDRFNLQNDSNCDDLAALMFYPHKSVFPDKDSQIQAIKNNIIDLFHLMSEKDARILPALIEIGISTNSILECDDKAIVDMVKNQWFNLINYEKNMEQQRIKSIRDNFLLENKHTANNLNQSDILADYLNQFEEYNSMLMNINRDAINDCKTIKEIIAIWPAVLQPQPWYVYEY